MMRDSNCLYRSRGLVSPPHSPPAINVQYCAFPVEFRGWFRVRQRNKQAGLLGDHNCPASLRTEWKQNHTLRNWFLASTKRF